MCRRLFISLFLPLFALLTACVHTPPPQEGVLPPVARATVRDFAVEGRFALQSGKEGERDGASGRLSWQHFEAGGNGAVGSGGGNGGNGGSGEGGDALLLSSPMGQGMAELIATPKGAYINTSDGKHYADSDPERLLRDILGYPLPLRALPRLMLGRSQSGDKTEVDSAGRPRVIRRAGWTVAYEYADDLPDGLPRRIEATAQDGLELRLVIESWDTRPDPKAFRQRLFVPSPPETFIPPAQVSGSGS